MPPSFGLLHFREEYVERIWGGRALESRYGKSLPAGKAIGEAWLVSDHPSAQSIVDEGPHAGRTLHELLDTHPAAMLGTHAALTAHGRFPLLLKLLDCNDALSVQVHPDDACAAALGEPDPGKTEMWHVIDVRPGSELICGLDPGVTSARLRQAVLDNALEPYLERFTVVRGDSVYVPAGVVHAICPGLVLAEIQQNSDLTYRLYDWGRIQPDGTPRALHVEKAAQAIRYGFRHPGKSPALGIGHPGAGRQVLAACRFFAAELFQVANSCTRVTRGAAFHILLARDGRIEVSSGGSHRSLSPGEAVLVPGAAESWQADGDGALLDYYVPDLDRDIVAPLRDAGHSHLAVMRLVGD